MTKLCPRGKAAAKRKFKVYPSAYANAYASKICAGKIKDPSGVKRKDFRGSKASGGRAGFKGGGADSGRIGQLKSDLQTAKNRSERIEAIKKAEKDFNKFKRQPNRNIPKGETKMGPVPANKRKNIRPPEKKPSILRKKVAGGGLMEATARLQRQGLKGGGICTKGMNKDAVGKNS